MVTPMCRIILLKDVVLVANRKIAPALAHLHVLLSFMRSLAEVLIWTIL